MAATPIGPEFNSVDQFIAIIPALILAAVAGLAKALQSTNERRVSELLTSLVVSAFTGAVLYFWLFDSTTFTPMSKMAMIAVGSYASNSVLPLFERSLKKFLENNMPWVSDSGNNTKDSRRRRKRRKDDDEDDDFYDLDRPPPNVPRRYTDEGDDRVQRPDLDDDNEDYCMLPDPVRKPKPAQNGKSGNGSSKSTNGTKKVVTPKQKRKTHDTTDE